MKYFLILLIFLFTGCVTPIPTSTLQIHREVQPKRCFYCKNKNFLPISYGTIPHPGHILYGLPVKEWRYHCIKCGEPTTGNKKRDQNLQKKE